MLYQLSESTKYPTKKSAPLISPATYVPETTRANDNVLSWGGFGIVDVDDYTGSIDDISEVYSGYKYVCYSTASSTKEHPKFRLVFPLTKWVDSEQIKHFWYALNKEIGDIADVSRIFVNTNMAAAAGAFVAMLATQLAYGKVDLTMVLNGALAGLVSITAEPLTPTMGWTCFIGGVGGVIVVYGVPLLDKFKIDDVVGAIPVHLSAGIWGTLAVVLTNPEAALGTQIYGIVVVGVFTFVISGAAWVILNAILGIRVSEEDEITGLDTAELGMEAYPDFVR